MLLPADLDALLKATGVSVAFSSGAPTFGKYRESEVLGVDDNQYSIAATGSTLLIRDGTQPATLAEGDPVTVNGVLKRIQDLGVRNTDGTRLLHLEATRGN